MRYPFLAGLLMGAGALLSACGGGGNSGAPIIPAPSPTPATGTASIGPAGGSISLTIASGTVKLTVPAGAVATAASFSFAAYSSDNLAKPFARRRTAIAGSIFLLGFTIDDGGVPLYAPLKVSVTGPVGGSALRLAMYGTKSATYTDVDTASETGTTITNANNSAYVGISTASVANPYVLYAISTSTAATPAPIALTATTTTAQPLAVSSTATFSGSGADANGNPDAFIPTYALSNASIGTLTSQLSPPYQATLTTAMVSATANIVVTDAVRKVTSNTAVSVGVGSPSTYTGSWSQTFARLSPSEPPVTTTAALTEMVGVTSGATFNAISGLYDSEAVDTSVANLDTTTSTTDTYNGFNPAATQLLDYGYKFNDGAGSTTTSTYLTPQLVDQVPETVETWTNTGATTIQENDASGEASTLTYAADGSYSENTTYPAQSITSGAAAAVVENTDGSGSITLQPYDVVFAYSAPSAGSVTMTESQGGGVLGSLPITLWFAATPVLYSETDVNSAASTLPAGCKVSASVPASTNKLEQTINRLDTIFGFTETTVIDSYIAAGNGALCSVMSDTLNNYYNLQGDTVTTYAWGSTSYQTTTTTQTLALQTGGSETAARASQTMLRVARAAFEGRVATVRDKARRAALKNLIHVFGLGKGTVR